MDDYEKKHAQELYLSIRIKQINFLIYAFIVANTYLLLYAITKYYIMYDQFDITSFKSTPTTHEASLLYFLFGLFTATPPIINYIAFYFIIRKDYNAKTKKIVKKKNPNTENTNTPNSPIQEGLFLTDEIVNKAKKDNVNNNINEFML